MLLKEKSPILEWLNKYQVENYTLRPDEPYGYVVDVAGDLYLWNKNLTEICVKFGKVTGNFYCSNNKLTSLEGCPKEVQKDFWCQDNQLTSLKGCPHNIGGNFYCHDNQLTSLMGCPHTVGKDFFCYSNQLNSLEGMPEVVEGRFYCYDNPNLGELQKIQRFKEIKAYLLSKKLANDLNIKDNKKNIKL